MTVVLANLNRKNDRLLILLLICAAFFVALIGWYSPYKTACYVAGCKLVFITVFSVQSNHRYFTFFI